MDSGNKMQIIRLVQLLARRKISYFLSLLGNSLMSSSVSIVSALLVASVLNAISEKNMHSIYIVCLLFSIIFLVICVLTAIFQYWFGKTVKAVMVDIRLQIFHHMEKLPVSYYENNHSGDSLSRITNDLSSMEHAFTDDPRTLVTLLMTGGCSVVIIFYLDWRFAVAMMFLGTLSTLVNSLFAKPIRTISAEIQKASGIHLERLSNLIAGSQVSRIFQMSDNVNRKYKESNQNLADLSFKRFKKSAYLNSTNYLLLWINNGGAFIIGAIMLSYGQIAIGSFLGVVLLLENVTNLFRNLGVFWANFQSSLAGADRVFELINTPEEPERYQHNADIVEIRKDEKWMIDFQNVSFFYKEGENVLNEIDFQVDKGQLVALVGPSGGGKSTIIKLLLGLYPPQLGIIRIQGKRITDYSLEELREKMAYVSQDPYLFEGTIEQNIRYGRMDATMEEIIEAARAAYAHDFIEEQVDGYNTMVGERGGRLSGGQKQRIAIARAILKNAPILLLDEATSALDYESEKAVQLGLERLMEGKTTIAVAHRLSTIKQADNIYVIEDGTVTEKGSHSNLLDIHGAYNRLFQIQTRMSL